MSRRHGNARQKPRSLRLGSFMGDDQNNVSPVVEIFFARKDLVEENNKQPLYPLCTVKKLFSIAYSFCKFVRVSGPNATTICST